MKSLLLITTLLFSIFASATIAFTPGKLSSATNDYGLATSVDENSTTHLMLGVIFPDASGHTGIAADLFNTSPLVSQVTGKPNGSQYITTSSGIVPVVELVSFSGGAVVPFAVPASALSKIATISCTAGTGGAVSQALTCTGLVTTDTVLAVTQKTVGANGLALVGYSTLAANSITAIWHADPGAGSVVQVTVLHQ